MGICGGGGISGGGGGGRVVYCLVCLSVCFVSYVCFVSLFVLGCFGVRLWFCCFTSDLFAVYVSDQVEGECGVSEKMFGWICSVFHVAA